MTENDYLIAWGLYAFAALGCLLVWMRMTRWIWRWLREPLRLLMAVLLFSPTIVDPVKEQVAPALAIVALDVREHKLEQAIAFTKDKKYRHSHLARVLAAGLTEFQYETSQDLPDDFDIVESGKRAIEREALMTTAEMKKGLGNLATISTTAPFVGLFGTVIGIINAFRGMALSGSGGLGAVSAGIAEALGATALGLFVAIPAVWMYNYFIDKVERFQVEMSNSSSQLVDYFIKNEARSRART